MEVMCCIAQTKNVHSRDRSLEGDVDAKIFLQKDSDNNMIPSDLAEEKVTLCTQTKSQ
jgi:hypothetical protein